MDYRERKRLEDEIDRGVPNVGIRKVEEGALERENRSPLVKGGAIGFSLGGAAGVAYVQSNSIFNRSPLGLFLDDYVLVMLGIIAGGTLMGAAGGWLFNKVVPKRGKSPKDAP
jgi:hypothetical protein